MSQENLDLARSIHSAWEQGDFSETEWAHPEIELVAADGATPGSSVGLARMAAGMRDFLSAWQNLRAEPEEYRSWLRPHSELATTPLGRSSTPIRRSRSHVR
jgi:hypothetical protein